MFSKNQRLKQKEVEEVFFLGRSIHSPNLTFRFFLKNKHNAAKISFAVPKKITPRATKRNLMRRRGYSVLKKNLLNIPKGLHGMFVFKSKALEVFGGHKNKNHTPIKNLEFEIKNILARL